MPPARGTRRIVLNENDENAPRVTRAKAAALGVGSDAPQGAAKKALQPKKTSTNVHLGNDNAQPRKRAALVDVSNVNKQDLADVNKEVKKAAHGAVSKAAHPTGVQKVSRTNSTRSLLGPKEKAVAGNELKRPASVAGVGNVSKKRSTSSNSKRYSTEEEEEIEENVRPIDDDVAVEIIEKTKVTHKADGTVVEKETKRVEKVIPKNTKTAEELQLEETVQAMDEDDEDDPLMVSEYVYEILDYMKGIEETTMANPDYMDHQKALEWRMRGVLVDWLLEVHTRFHLLPETFYLTVNILDRFLSAKTVELGRLQLVGVTAMFIASKYEEVLSPHIANFRHVAEDAFSEEEILSAERFMLSTLNYDLSFPNPMHFMRRISKADNYDIQTRTLAKYLMEITLLDHRFLQFKPSINAAAAMHLARVILEKGPWDPVLVHYSGYTEQDFRLAYKTMIDYLRSPVEHTAFFKKYAGKKFLKASIHARAWAKDYSGDLSDVSESKKSSREARGSP